MCFLSIEVDKFFISIVILYFTFQLLVTLPVMTPVLPKTIVCVDYFE